MPATATKRNGVHYTPPELAQFLAAVTVEQIDARQDKIEVLDPACGDGALLQAFAQALPAKLRQRVTLVGYETDASALQRAEAKLRQSGVAQIELTVQDFLTTAGGAEAASGRQLSLLESTARRGAPTFDVVIANPPYVRTQVLGAARAQALARTFRLTGRVDLYQAFVKGMARVLKPKGILGLLTSNRFLTIKSGMAMRKLLISEFALQAIFDLGDTKLFSAAVLPVIVVARKSPPAHEKVAICRFDRVYEHRADTRAHLALPKCNSVLDAVREKQLSGLIRTPTGTYRLERGDLARGGGDEIWSLSTPDYRDWLQTIADHRQHVFDEIARIRVGIKTTADDVFLRDEWTSLPRDRQPESTLIRPLIRHFDAVRWLGPNQYRQKVLYPHEMAGNRRVAVNLDDFPRAKRYLESHRGRLESRQYVTESGREWYEIWVPQSPEDWARPKIVFPDIAEAPRFFLDKTGAIVNGDCYWITLRAEVDPRLLLLMLAVANSTFVTRYYDVAFHNKLYAGRRRFMTQYVRQFPLPDLESRPAREIVHHVADILETRQVNPAREAVIDQLVWRSFGLVKES